MSDVIDALASALDWATNTRTGAVTLYGLVVSVVAGLSLVARQECNVKLAWWQALGWMAANLIFAAAGPGEVLWITAATNTVVVLNLVPVAIRHSCRTTWEVIRLYCLQFVVLVVAALYHDEGTPLCFAVLNIIFLMRMVVTGGASGLALAREARNRRERVDNWSAIRI